MISKYLWRLFKSTEIEDDGRRNCEGSFDLWLLWHHLTKKAEQYAGELKILG